MKGLLAGLLLTLFLTGCGSGEIDKAMTVRDQLQSSNGCSFVAEITADYGDAIYEFAMECLVDQIGNLSFTVLEPETICGITGNIRQEKGQLTFDDKVLAFELMADGQITPVSTPWILMHTLRSGYLNACTDTDEGMMLVIDDSYEEDALKLNIWLSQENLPREAEIFWDGNRILTLTVSDFTYL